MISLKIIYNDGEKESLVFNQPVITIGRSSDNDVSLITAHGVSRHHAKLYREGDNLIIEDLNSTNGTYVNSQKISRNNVTQKDVIEIGSVCIKAVISNLAESSLASSQSKNEVIISTSPVEILRTHLSEAFEKISERTVEKVIVRSNARVKFIEQGQEVELGIVYSDDALNKVVSHFNQTSCSSRVKITNNTICSVLRPPLVNDGVCICFEKIYATEFLLEDYLDKGVLCKDSEKIVTEAYARGKNIIFAGPNKKLIQELMLTLVLEKDSRVCFLDRFSKLFAPKNSISFSARSVSDLMECAQFSNDVGLQRFFIDDIENYSKSNLNAFADMFSKGGVCFMPAEDLRKLHSKIAEMSGYGTEFWCHVLIWLEQKEENIFIKTIFKAANTDTGLELVEIFSKE